MRTVCWDIEAGGLKANVDQVYCAGFKPYGEDAYVIARHEDDTSDEWLCKKIAKELDKYDIIVTYYGLDFDKPFMNSRLLKHGLPILPRQLHLDCYRLAKKIFKRTLVSKRLISVCELLSISGKGRVEFDKWEVFKYGTSRQKKKSLDEIAEHCLWDVITLDEVLNRFKDSIISISLS